MSVGRRIPEVAVPNVLDRNYPASAFAEVARLLESSGVVDYMQTWEQLANFWPPVLWNTKNTPLAAVVPDVDSYPDMFVMSGYGISAAPSLGLAISTDSIRHGPAELTQSMLTLANITEGRTVLMMGAGELKQTQPFGWKRSQGLDRMEDQFKIFNAFWDSDKPISYEGKHWTMSDAWLGVAKTHRPKLWALGGGPRLFDLATSYADGLSSMAPYVKSTPDEWAATVASLKQDLERKGRDPEAFDFALWFPMLLHEDADFVERTLDNPLMTWIAAVCGRLNQSDWDKVGLEPPMPRDWHYSINMLPQQYTEAEALAICARVSHEMSERSCFYGSSEKVAAEIEEYVDAGATWVSLIDLMPAMLPADQAQEAIGRSLELARILKGKSS